MPNLKTLENGNVSVEIPIRLRRRGARLRIEVIGQTQEKPESLLLNLARAYRWREMLDNGKYKSIEELADDVKWDKAYVGRTLRLLYLSPELIHRIIEGNEPDGLSLDDLRKSVPILWEEQKVLYG